MLDYCLIQTLTYNHVDNVQIYGDFCKLHPLVDDLMAIKKIRHSDSADLVILYKKSGKFINQYWETILTPKVKWFFIVPSDEKEAEMIFKQMRSFGEAVFIKYPQPLIVIKNIIDDFRTKFRRDLLKPIEPPDFVRFFNINHGDTSQIECEKIVGTKEEQIVHSLNSGSVYVYFGDKVPEKTIDDCKSLTQYALRIMKCVDIYQNKTVGVFAANFDIEKALIIYLSEIDFIEKKIGLEKFTLLLPVY